MAVLAVSVFTNHTFYSNFRIYFFNIFKNFYCETICSVTAASDLIHLVFIIPRVYPETISGN